jgi:DNA-binding MarR family transcriptional regulator
MTDQQRAAPGEAVVRDHGMYHRLGPEDIAQAGPAQLVMMLAHRIRRNRLVALEPFGLAVHQARAFSIIARHADTESLRPSDLARRLDIAPRSATEVVDALEEKGLVVRRPSPTDRRATVLSLTAQGRDLQLQMRHQPSPEDAGVFAGLSPDELVRLTALLRKAAGVESSE